MIRFNLIFLFLLLIFTTSARSSFIDNSYMLHEFHISKTDMVFNPKEKTLQITMHIFIDDLEIALEKQGYKSLSVGTEKEKKEANTYISQYLFNQFSVKVNNKYTQYDILGKETSRDRQALYIYMEIKNIKDIRNIFVENKVLTEIYDDQKNIIQVNIPSKRQGYFLLDRNKTADSAQF